MKPQPVLNSPDNKLSQKGIIKPLEVAPKMSFGEPNKSVRFKMDWGHEPKENKGIFGQSMFGNPFGSFINRTVPKQNPQNDGVVSKIFKTLFLQILNCIVQLIINIQYNLVTPLYRYRGGFSISPKSYE